jgi:hypothetical protein
LKGVAGALYAHIVVLISVSQCAADAAGLGRSRRRVRRASYAHTNTITLSLIHTLTHTYIHAHSYTLAHTYTHAHSYTYTHTLLPVLFLGLPDALALAPFSIHVRRTDKIGTEAQFHHLEEYMKHALAYFDRHHGPAVQRRIYLATDDPSVIDEARKTYARQAFLCVCMRETE